MSYDYYEHDELATPHDAMLEYASEVGYERPDSAWILTPYDVWVANPFYSGPEVPHPESDYQSDEEWYGFRDDVEADADTLASAGWGTDEDYGYYGDGEF